MKYITREKEGERNEYNELIYTDDYIFIKCIDSNSSVHIIAFIRVTGNATALFKNYKRINGNILLIQCVWRDIGAVLDGIHKWDALQTGLAIFYKR